MPVNTYGYLVTWRFKQTNNRYSRNQRQKAAGNGHKADLLLPMRFYHLAAYLERNKASEQRR